MEPVEKTSSTEPVEAHSNTEEQPKGKISFSSEQQQRVDEIIREAQGRAAKELRQERDALRNQLDLRETELRGYRESADPELARTRELLAAETTRRQKAEESERNSAKSAALSAALAQADVLSVGDALTLIKDSFRYEGSALAAIDPNTGAVREGVSVQQAVSEFLASRQFLVRAQVRKGAGSAPSQEFGAAGPRLDQIFGKGSSAEAANNLAMRDPRQYARLRQKARAQGLIR
jgi:hypothetical protein